MGKGTHDFTGTEIHILECGLGWIKEAQDAFAGKLFHRLVRDHPEVSVSLHAIGLQSFSGHLIGELPKDLALAGVTVESMPSGEPGVLVTNVAPRSQAERAGLRKNDILLEINRKAIRHIDDFTRITQTLSPQKAVLVLLKRESATIFLSIQPQKS